MSIKLLYSSIVSAIIFLTISANGIAGENDRIKFKFLSTKIVIQQRGINNKTVTWKDAKHTKGLIVALEVKVPRDMTLWSTDFNTFYIHKNDKDLEDRGMSRGMSLAVSSPEDEGAWVIGNYVKTQVKAGTRYIKLIFPLEDDVDSISIHYSHPVIKDIPINRH